jgi:hypothetical protein
MVVEKVETALWAAVGALVCAALSFVFSDTSLMIVLRIIAGAAGLTAIGYAFAAVWLAAKKLDAMHAALAEPSEVSAES